MTYSQRAQRRDRIYAICSLTAGLGMFTSMSGIIALVWGGHMVQYALGLSAPVMLSPSFAIGCAYAMAAGIVACFAALVVDLAC